MNHSENAAQQRKLQNDRIQYCYKLKRFIIWVEAVGDYSNVSDSQLESIRREYDILLREKNDYLYKRPYKKEIRYGYIMRNFFACPFCQEPNRVEQHRNKGIICKCGVRALYIKNKTYRCTLKTDKNYETGRVN